MKNLITDESLQADPAEQSVLGGLMLDNEALDRVIYRLSPTDFYGHNHQIIYNTILELAASQQPFDALALSEALKERGQLDEAGGEIYLLELAKNTPSAANNTVAYADIVRRRSVLRQLISKVNEREKQQEKVVKRIIKNSEARSYYLELIDDVRQEDDK